MCIRDSLVDDCEGDGNDRARLVQHDLRRSDAPDPRHEGEERVPEREGVARMQAAVGELVHRTDV